MVTRLPEALTRLRDHNVTFELTANGVVVSAPIEMLTPELGAWLKKYQSEFTELLEASPEYLSYPCPSCDWPLSRAYKGQPQSPQQCIACGEYSGIVEPVQTWSPDWPVDWPAR
jgi:hypothetical protein